MAIANVFTVECDDGMEHEDFRIREAQIGPRLDAELIGESVYEIDLGKKLWPYHLHHANEEWLGGTPNPLNTGTASPSWTQTSAAAASPPKSTSLVSAVPAVRPGALWSVQYRFVCAITWSGGGAPHAVRSSVV
jgi:hypothetical protein